MAQIIASGTAISCTPSRMGGQIIQRDVAGALGLPVALRVLHLALRQQRAKSPIGRAVARIGQKLLARDQLQPTPDHRAHAGLSAPRHAAAPHRPSCSDRQCRARHSPAPMRSRPDRPRRRRRAGRKSSWSRPVRQKARGGFGVNPSSVRLRLGGDCHSRASGEHPVHETSADRRRVRRHATLRGKARSAGRADPRP